MARPRGTALERLISIYRQMRPEERAMVRPALAGFDAAMAAKQEPQPKQRDLLPQEQKWDA